ncbi:MAG: hypothetical protein AAGN66_02805 [Acidobacteriota bacterium]
MKPYQGMEVSGHIVLAVVEVMGAFRSVALKVLEKNGIVDPRPERWYPLAAWLSSFETIVQDVGPNTLHIIGRHVSSTAPLPPEIANVEAALQALDDAYHGQHRGSGDIGHYHFISSGERSGTMICTTPYPSDFDRGVIQALVERLEPDGLTEVRLDTRAESRKGDGKSCTYLVSW